MFLKDNVDKLHAVAKVLIEKEKITGEEFDAIFRGEDILAKVKEEKKKAEEAKAEENKNEEKVEEKKEDKKEEENK